MPTLSLVTDFGYDDLYLSLLKIKISCKIPSYRLVELSHSSSDKQKMGRLKLFGNILNEFEKSSIHLVLINTEYTKCPRFISFQYKTQYIVAPDNGIMSDYFNDTGTYIALENMNNYNQIFDHLIQHIKQLNSTNPWDNLKPIKPRISVSGIRKNTINDKSIFTTVFYIDNFGNLYCNLLKDDFEHARKNRNYKIQILRDTVNEINNSIGDNECGRINVFFNTFGYLEISIAGANAAEMLGLKLSSVISIVFE